MRPHRQQPTRLPRPWDSPGKNTGVGCHFLLQCMKVKSESEVAQSCPTLSDPMGCSPPGSSIHGIFQARVLEWGAIAFSGNWYSHYEKQYGGASKNLKYICYPDPEATLIFTFSTVLLCWVLSCAWLYGSTPYNPTIPLWEISPKKTKSLALKKYMHTHAYYSIIYKLRHGNNLSVHQWMKE